MTSAKNSTLTTENPGYNSGCRPGDRELTLEESPDTTGQDAGEIPGGESRRKVEQKANRLWSISGGSAGKGEMVG
jgi:hypothetical protein